MSLFLHSAPPNSVSGFYPCFSLSRTATRLSKKPSSTSMAVSARACSGIPARDRVIDFGKYKGRMLGTLPSTYLRWVTNNLRARDFEEWAKLADQVLQDPVYQDRLEWELAHKVLNGDVLNTLSSSSSSSGVSALVEISERFGWDNEDKLGWSKLNFELLGTSSGGRIPRIAPDKDKGGFKLKKRGKDLGLLHGGRRGGEEKGRPNETGRDEEEEEEELGVRKRREARRERLKLKTSQRLNPSRGGVDREEMKLDKSGAPGKNQTAELYNLFPGREGLLRKVLNARGKRGIL